MRAFSLIETMVVVGIVGVMAALAVPIMTVEIHKAELNGATEGAANFIARTRAEAMRTKRCTQIEVTAAELRAFRLNTFNCDQDVPGVALRIDSTQPALIPIDTFKAEQRGAGTITFALETKPAHPPTGQIVRFRPSGRVFSNDTLTNVPVLTNDDALFSVSHARLGTAPNNLRRILVEGHGLICALERGAAPLGAAPNFTCP